MNLDLTLGLLVVFALFGIFCGWRGARPLDFTKGPRMMPWRFLMLVSAALVMLLLIHVVSLLGGGPAPTAY